MALARTKVAQALTPVVTTVAMKEEAWVKTS